MVCSSVSTVVGSAVGSAVPLVVQSSSIDQLFSVPSPDIKTLNVPFLPPSSLPNSPSNGKRLLILSSLELCSPFHRTEAPWCRDIEMSEVLSAIAQSDEDDRDFKGLDPPSQNPQGHTLLSLYGEDEMPICLGMDGRKVRKLNLLK